jgi:hypothetical protein
VDIASSVRLRSALRVSSERYEDALDAIRLYSMLHPEWKSVIKAIEEYVMALEGNVGLHEPGT